MYNAWWEFIYFKARGLHQVFLVIDETFRWWYSCQLPYNIAKLSIIRSILKSIAASASRTFVRRIINFLIKKYNIIHKEFTSGYLTFQSAQQLLKSINLSKWLKSYKKKNITTWDIYNVNKNKNIFYSPETNIISYFTGYNYNSDSEVNMNVIQLFINQIMNTICDDKIELNVTLYSVMSLYILYIQWYNDIIIFSLINIHYTSMKIKKEIYYNYRSFSEKK